MEIELKTQEIRTCPGVRSIQCEKGSIWITWPGGGDVILKESEKVHIKTRGKILIENLDRETAGIRLG